MNKKLSTTNFRIIMGLFLVLYIFLLIYVIVLKSGDAFIIARHFSNISFSERISKASIVPFKTIYDYLFNDINSGIAIKNLLANISALAPMGFLLPTLFHIFKKSKNIFFISIVISLSIEIVQLIFVLGTFDVDDIILNVLGAISGFQIYKLYYRYLKDKIIDV